MKENQFSVVGQYLTPAEAHIVAGRLRSAGILAEVADAHMVGANWLYSQAIGGVRVRVPTEQHALALEILAEEAEPEVAEKCSEAPSALSEEVILCPQCGSSENYYFRSSIGSLVTWLLLGLPLLLPRGFRRCEQCDHQWRITVP